MTSVSMGTVQAPRTSAPRWVRGGLPVVGRLSVSALAGLALLLAFPSVGLWWLAPVGVAGLVGVTFGARPGVGAWCGLVAGLVVFLPLLSWTNLHTGVLPRVLLAVSQAAFVALLGASTNTVLRILGIRDTGSRRVTEEEIAASLEEGLDAGVIEAQEHQMVRNVFRLDDRQVGSMIDRKSVV